MVNEIVCATALSLVAAASAYAQHGTTDSLVIRLTGGCEGVTAVSVVMDGADQEFSEAEPFPPIPCRWLFKSPYGTYNTKNIHFSLRLGIARTRCKKARWDGKTGNVTFEFKKQGVQQWSVVTEPPMTVKYARVLEGSLRDVPCIEDGTMPATLHDVQLDVETLRVRLSPKKSPACGLALNYVARVRKAKPGATVRVTPDDAMQALAAQANGGDDCRGPGVSVSQIEIDERNLARRPPPSIVITVKGVPTSELPGVK